MFANKEDVPHVAISVDNAKIAENDYNLSVSSYVEAKDTREKIDIVELNTTLETTIDKVNKLRSDIDAIVKELTV
jgi:type I restriction enzyme M protein